MSGDVNVNEVEIATKLGSKIQYKSCDMLMRSYRSHSKIIRGQVVYGLNVKVT